MGLRDEGKIAAMIQPVNWKLASHPMNWLTILVMLIIAGAFGHLLLSYFEVEPASQSGYSDVSPGIVPSQGNIVAISPQSAYATQSAS